MLQFGIEESDQAFGEKTFAEVEPIILIYQYFLALFFALFIHVAKRGGDEVTYSSLRFTVQYCTEYTTVR